MRSQQPQNRKGNHQYYQLTIFLMTLINGDGATKRHTTIHLSNRTRFHDFVTILRDATSLCTMPEDYQPSPWMIDFEDSPSTPFPDLFNSSQSTRTLSFGTSSTASSLTLPMHASEFTAASSTRAPNRLLRGFTLDDGPWLYHVVTSQETETQPEHEIRDECTYRKMMAEMEDAKGHARVLMIHVRTMAIIWPLMSACMGIC